MERCLVIYSLRLSPLLTLVASRRRLLLQGKSDTLRTGERVPGPQKSQSGRSFESYGVRVAVTFSSQATCRPGACLLGWEQGAQKPGPDANWSRAACRARPEPGGVSGSPPGSLGGFWPLTGLDDRWFVVSSPAPKHLVHPKHLALGGGGYSWAAEPGSCPRAGPIHRQAERCVGRASPRVVPSEPGLCGPRVRQPPEMEGGVPSSGFIG